MSWYTIFYLFGVADKVSLVFGILTILIGIALAITVFGAIASDETWNEKVGNEKWTGWQLWRKFFFTFAITFFISITLWTFVPNQKQMTLIVAGGVVGEFISNDENAKKLPADVMRFLRAEVNKATADLDLEDLGVKELDTLKDKSKEELMEMIKNQNK